MEKSQVQFFLIKVVRKLLSSLNRLRAIGGVNSNYFLGTISKSRIAVVIAVFFCLSETEIAWRTMMLGVMGTGKIGEIIACIQYDCRLTVPLKKI